MNDKDAIYVNDPVYIEEIVVARGDIEDRDGPVQTLYLQKYEDDTRYAVIDEWGKQTNRSFSGDPGSNIQAVHDLFDDIYGDSED